MNSMSETQNVIYHVALAQTSVCCLRPQFICGTVNSIHSAICHSPWLGRRWAGAEALGQRLGGAGQQGGVHADRHKQASKLEVPARQLLVRRQDAGGLVSRTDASD